MRCPPVEVPTCIWRCRPPRSYRNAASAAFFIGAVTVIFCAPGHYRFRLYAESLSLCLRERESNQRESAPGIRVSLRETSLVPALFRGSSRRAIPGPSFLIWHPCQMSLCTAPALLAALALRASLRLLLRFATFRPPDGTKDRGVCKSVGAVLTAKLLTVPVHCLVGRRLVRLAAAETTIPARGGDCLGGPCRPRALLTAYLISTARLS